MTLHALPSPTKEPEAHGWRLRDQHDERAVRLIAPRLRRLRFAELEAAIVDPELTLEERQAAQRIRAVLLRAWRLEQLFEADGVAR